MRRLVVMAFALILAGETSGTVVRVPDDQPTIQLGIDAASYGDTVLVACDTYYEHDIIMKSGVYLTSETGLPDCATIDAQQQGRVIYCLNVNDAAGVVGFTITGGSAADGGGMYCSSSSPVLTDCTFLGNDAEAGDGGGMYCCNSSSPSLTRCKFTGNHTPGEGLDDGGGLYCLQSSPTLTDCEFSWNTAYAGGGVHCWDSSPTLTDCEFSSNHAVVGSGMGVQGYTSSPTLIRCIFVGNQAEHSGGGFYSYHSIPTLTDCTFSGNQAGVGGGGMRCYQRTPILTGCTFSDNVAENGGGMFCYGQYLGGNPVLTNCTFSGNHASSGGAVYCTGYSTMGSSPTLTNCTLYDNQADAYGAGLYCENESFPSLTNTVIAFGAAGEAIYCADTASAPELACCDIFGNVGGDWVGCIAQQYGVDGNFSEDPRFCLHDNPGEPYSLHEGSPCLPESSPCGELVGAFGLGCGPVTPIEDRSWGAIKAIYR